MLRIATLSLLLGSVALAFGVYTLYLPASTSNEVSPLIWPAASGSEVGGNGEASDMQMELNPEGQGVVVLPVLQFRAADYPFMYLEFAQSPEYDALQIFWASDPAQAQARVYEIRGAVGESHWLDTRKIPGWVGNIGVLGLSALGQPGSNVQLAKVELLPTSLAGRWQVAISSWTTFSTWKGYSINIHTGVHALDSELYPVPVVGSLVILALLSYGLLLLLFRDRLSFDWRVAAIIFMCGWIALDSLWQGKMLYQIRETYEKFADKSTEDQLAIGPDATLVRFISDVKGAIDGKEARVFVSSEEEYFGMRSAYYLYPQNVYWKRKKSWLPRARHMAPGDYILLLHPANFQFDPAAGLLTSVRGRKRFRVEQILSGDTGSLFRVR